MKATEVRSTKAEIMSQVLIPGVAVVAESVGLAVDFTRALAVFSVESYRCTG